MREITPKVYTFDELSDEAKKRARDWYREGIDYEWWDFIYTDAEVDEYIRINEYEFTEDGQIA